MKALVEQDIRRYGQTLEIRREGQLVQEVFGVKDPNKGRFILRSGTDVHTNDTVVDTANGSEYHVTDVSTVPTEAIIAEYETVHQRQARSEASRPSNISIGDVYGSNVNTGTQRDLSMNPAFDFRSIEREIDRRGGGDADELREALDEVRQMVERDGALEKGALKKFGEVFQRNAWFTSHVGQQIVQWLAQAAGI